jgi:hypothetical protein
LSYNQNLALAAFFLPNRLSFCIILASNYAEANAL